MASRTPPVAVVCHACGWNCTTKCYAIHKDSFSCHQRTCKLHVGQPYTELKNNVIVPSLEYRDAPKEAPISDRDFQPEPVRLPSNHPITCMECDDNRCSFGCMDSHKGLDNSKYYYCHNKHCINHTSAVHVNIDEKGGRIYSRAPKQRPESYPETPRYESRREPPRRDDYGREGPRPEYREARPGRDRGEYYEYTAEPPRREPPRSRRDESYYPPRPGAPRTARRKSTSGSHGPAPHETPRTNRERSRARGEEPERTRRSRSRAPEGYAEGPERRTRSRAPDGSEPRSRSRAPRGADEFYDPMDDLNDRFGSSSFRTTESPPRRPSYHTRPSDFYPPGFDDFDFPPSPFDRPNYNGDRDRFFGDRERRGY
ncbi:hypothetical protein QBC44DRAFT_303625 [Cladorrhinum sp. PSN332]|nr:hypothetical protein QBC44DRAFT_303625 [Cladorrhinum sp. PSN332]